MKKILFTLFMLCSMTIAWAGTGTGSPKDPYTGYWNANVLISQLKEGDHLAYNCYIDGDFFGNIFVYDDKLNNANVYKNFEWTVGDLIGSNDPFPQYYEDYYSSNSPEDRKNHTFIVTKAESPDGTTINITGHYSGRYIGGDGSKEHPYTGEWNIADLFDKLKKGDHIALACDIKGSYNDLITVKDIRLNQEIAGNWVAWSPGNFIGEKVDAKYTQYGKDNPPANRITQTFIVDDKNVEPYKGNLYFTIIGYFSGFYSNTDADGFVHVASAEQMHIILRGNSNVTANDHAKVRLTQDIFLSDKGDNDDTFCSTFYGTLDGDGYTIYGDDYGENSTERRNRNYLFTYSEGATFKNLTFKHIRKNSNDHSNQAIITSQAKNNCVFENITFDNVGSWSNFNNVGAAAGYAYNSTFTNIKVKNSDFTVDDNYVGTVVGDADKCTFTDIEIQNCEATAYDNCAGGVVGHARNCSFKNIDIKNCYIKVDGMFVGGVAGKGIEGSAFENCFIDDQNVVYCNGIDKDANAGGVCGHANIANLKNCYNLGVVASEGESTGGIVGFGSECFIESCLNAGLIISIGESDLNKYIVPKYRAKQFKCINASNGNLSFTVQHLDVENINRVLDKYDHMGGIVGDLIHLSNIHNCANYSQIYNRECIFSGGIAGNVEDSYTVDHNYNAPTANGLPFKTGHGPMSDEPMDFPTLPDDMDWANWVEFGGICGSVHPVGRNTYLCFNVSADWHYTVLSGRGNGASGSHNFMFTLIPFSDSFQGTPTVEEFYTGHMTSLINKDSRTKDDNSPYIWTQDIAVDLYPKLHVKGRFFQPVDIPKETLGVYMTRTISNNYGTVCAPFKMKSDDNIKFYTFTKAESDEEGTALKFTYAEEVEKGTPVLFYSENTGEISFYNCGDTENAYSPDTVDVDQWSFRGVYRKTKFTGAEAQNVYYVSNGAIHNAKETTIDKFRAYFYGPSINSAAAKSIRFVLDEEDGSTTALNLSYDNENGTPCYDEDNTYTLIGTKAPAGYHGIVIKGGKKYIK